MVTASSQIRGTIVTAGGLDLTPLFDVLDEVTAGRLWVLGNEIGDPYLFDPQPDYVISVLAAPSNDDTTSSRQGFSNIDVILRAGRSVERRIPTLVLIPPSMPLPAPAADAMLVSCPLSDKEALKLHLWAFFAPILSYERPTETAPTVPVHLDTNLILTELHRLSDDEQPGLTMRVEQLANNLLHQAGAKVAAAQARRLDESHADRVDFAITPSDDAQNVVLVEVKAGRLTEDRLAHAEQQLRRYVMDRKASLGMVLYHDSTGRAFPPRHTVPRVIRLSLEELAERLESHSLTKIMSDAVADTIGKIKK